VTTLASPASLRIPVRLDVLIKSPATQGNESFAFLAEPKDQMSSKLAFPQFAQLEQNLQISHYVRDSCESLTQRKMPAYSVVKDHCLGLLPERPAPGGTSCPLSEQHIQKEGSEQ